MALIDLIPFATIWRKGLMSANDKANLAKVTVDANGLLPPSVIPTVAALEAVAPTLPTSPGPPGTPRLWRNGDVISFS